MDTIFRAYGDEVAALPASHSTTEPSYYPAIKMLLSKMLGHETLPFEVRASTSESRAGGGHDLPDLALYDGHGDYLVVAGEVKLPADDIKAIAFSEERNDQIGRYLAQTGVVLVSNVRGFGLLTVRRDAPRQRGRWRRTTAYLNTSSSFGRRNPRWNNAGRSPTEPTPDSLDPFEST